MRSSRLGGATVPPGRPIHQAVVEFQISGSYLQLRNLGLRMGLALRCASRRITSSSLRVKPSEADVESLGDGFDGGPLGVCHAALDARIGGDRQPRATGYLFLCFAALDAGASDRKAECLVHGVRGVSVVVGAAHAAAVPAS